MSKVTNIAAFRAPQIKPAHDPLRWQAAFVSIAQSNMQIVGAWQRALLSTLWGR